jgi:hypothetical protein
MEILSEGEMAARLDFARPLKPPPEEPPSLWCIPFEWGGLPKGTRISIAKAKEIAAELRASVAEAEKRELRRAFDQEKERADAADKRSADYQHETYQLKTEIAQLHRTTRAQRRLRARNKAGQ